MKNFLFALCFFILPFSAYADYVPPKFYKLAYPTTSTYYTNYNDACSAFLAHYQSITTGRNYSISLCSSTIVRIQSNPINSSYEASTTITTWKDCGQGYVLFTTAPNGMCPGNEPPPPCSAGDAGFSGIPQPSGSSASTLSPSSINQMGCKNGCLTKLDPSRGNWYGGSDGSSYNVYGYSNFTGATCSVTPSNPAPSNAPPAPTIKDCADAGKSYGTVNGVAVCVSAGTTGSAPVIQNKTGASSTTTPAPTPENPNPTPVTTKEPDSVVITVPPSATSDGTVKTTQTNADGSQTSTTESKESFCSKNPTNEQCQAKSLCEKNPDAPSCKDICEKKPDLLICKQTDIDQLCADKPDRWECKKAEDLIGKKDDLPNEELGKKTVNVGDNFNFNPVNIQSNATCPTPLTTAIAGATITVSFDWLCAYASAFRPLVMALAFFFAYGIIAAAIRADAQPYQRGLF